MRLSPFALLDQGLAPAPDSARIAFLQGQPFAHRGLHGDGVVENSRAAFDAAILAGHGIELDVLPSREGLAFVFHDDVLDRLTDSRGPVGVQSAADLEDITLSGTIETIPRLTEILTRVGGRVPILVEVKTESRKVGLLCLSVRRALEGYRGSVAIMSFNPEVCRWFATHSPRTVRGLVVTEGVPGTFIDRLKGRMIRHLSLWRAKPDFLAYDIRNLPSPFALSQAERGLALLTWTVRTADQERTALACGAEVIYERPVGGKIL
jgi:glycerophosphoryl diester phosphodiesterase